MACNVYRRLHGEWPETIRFAPLHFAAMAAEYPPESLTILASVFDLHVTSRERSPRLTVIGPHGAVTYDHGVTEQDWDTSPLDALLRDEAERLGLPHPDDETTR